jgi:hypothetical protein
MQVEACCVQEWKRIEEAWCIEWKHNTEHKSKKKKGKKMHI